jgi:hypothetical protein
MTAEGNCATPRRFLMVARDFPPCNSAASLRALAFTRHLGTEGWDTAVVTIRSAFHDSTDPSLVARVPDSMRIYRAWGVDSRRFSIRGRYPRLLAFPDRSASWALAAACQGLRAVRQGQVSALLSTSPPVTAHCVGFFLKRITQLPWIVELRDPWNSGGLVGPLSRRLDAWLEHRVLDAADRIVVTTDGLAAELARRFGASIGARACVVRNGYEADALCRRTATSPATPRFTIVHTGLTGVPGRDPQVVLEIIRECLDEGDLPADLAVQFMGSEKSEVEWLRRVSAKLHLDRVVDVRAHRPHEEALAAMCDASLLLLLQTAEDLRHCIPAKAYEYLSTGRAILAVAPADGETARFLRPFPGVSIVPPDDRSAIRGALFAAHAAWVSGCASYERPATELARYSRQEAAKRLAGVLSSVASPGGRE